MLRFPVWLGDYCMPDEAGTFTAPMKFELLELLRCVDCFRQAICGTIRLTNIGHCTALIQPRYVGLLGASTGFFYWHNAAAQGVEHSMDSTEKDSQNDDDSCWQIMPPSMRPFFVWLLSEKQEGVQWEEDIINNTTSLLRRKNDSHGHRNRNVKLLPSTLKRLLLLSVCPPKLSGAIFLFQPLRWALLPDVMDFLLNRNQSRMLIQKSGSFFPHFDECFNQMGWNQHTDRSPVVFLL